jgi:hypothetical protein
VGLGGVSGSPSLWVVNAFFMGLDVVFHSPLGYFSVVFAVSGDE